LFPAGEAAMRNLAMLAMILVGLYNVDHLFYHGAMLKPVFSVLWRHVMGLLSA
jgi:hypothetical protein